MKEFDGADWIAAAFVVLGWFGVVGGLLVIGIALDARSNAIGPIMLGLPIVAGGAVTVLMATLVRAVIRQVNLTNEVIAQLKKRPAAAAPSPEPTSAAPSTPGAGSGSAAARDKNRLS